MTPPDPNLGGAPPGAKKFPDYVPPTKVHYDGQKPATLHLRKCKLVTQVGGRAREHLFDKGAITIGAMEDNDLVVSDDTVSRYHCKIVQEDTSYLLVDLGSTNGTFINRVRIKEAYLKPGCTIGLGNTEVKFHAADEKVEILPSRKEKLGRMVGRHVKMRELYTVLEKIAPTATTVVIEGETGTGKEVVAQTIHDLSTRSSGPIMVFDCGAVPDNLIESELFGHEKGSFTGAVGRRIGAFEEASGGTIFLDEIGELTQDLQPKMLRVLESKEFRRVGGNGMNKTDVRVVAATNRDLRAEVNAGRFRSDLYFRLAVVKVTIPPLRERPDDIPITVDQILRALGAEQSQSAALRTPEFFNALSRSAWPGNVRELRNYLERCLVFQDALPVSAEGPRGQATSMAGIDPKLPYAEARRRALDGFERGYAEALLREHNGKVSAAAAAAGMDRVYLYRLLRRHGLKTKDH